MRAHATSVASSWLDPRRNALILATSLGLGLGVSFVPQITQALPTVLRNALASGIATGGMCALLLNILLPGERQ